jgi:membrane fusion protein (multidrug efflux system)
MSATRGVFARLRSTRPAALAGALLAAAALVAGVPWLLHLRSRVTTDDAFVEGTLSFLAAEVPGRVLEVAVAEHQRVRAGDVLVRLDPADYEARLAKARADLDAARNGMRAALASAGSAEAERRATEVELWRAERELERVSTLVESNAASRQRLEQAREIRARDRDPLGRGRRLHLAAQRIARRAQALEVARLARPEDRVSRRPCHPRRDPRRALRAPPRWPPPARSR